MFCRLLMLRLSIEDIEAAELAGPRVEASSRESSGVFWERLEAMVDGWKRATECTLS